MTAKMIKTDWIAIKSHHWRLIILGVLLIAFCFMGMSMIVIPLSSYMAMIFTTNTFAVEEKGRLDLFYLTLPVSRKNIVRGRFIFMFVCIAVALITTIAVTLNFVPTLQLGDYRYDINPFVLAVLSGGGFAFSGLVNLCMYPTMFRLGYEKGKVFGFYIPIFLLSAFVSGVTIFFNHKLDLIIKFLTYFTENTAVAGTRLSFILYGAGAILFGISYTLSQKIYENRNL
ncbi:MAG: ABC-2 transporter permease [Ruminococcus sp.]|jgi:hypothetical protein|nr:ABC-2 transporter permease [Ruminococcus sp.]